MLPANHLLPVNEIFETLQGEATHTGTPSVFVRLQGCDVGCPWCDTKHTWELGHKPVKPDVIFDKTDDADTHAFFDTQDLFAAIMQRFTAKHVVFTGGEPCIFDLQMITATLHRNGWNTQLETSGTYSIRCSKDTWVTVSPKVGMPGGRVVLDDALKRADEIKMPVGKWRDVERVLSLTKNLEPIGGVWLQPLSQNKKATDICIEAAAQYGWRVSLQTHKFAGLR